MILYRTTDGLFVEQDGRFYPVFAESLDALVVLDDLQGFLSSVVDKGDAVPHFDIHKLLAPIGSQEVWASGVTYYRSRSARMEESKAAGGGDAGQSQRPDHRLHHRQ